MFTYLGAAGQPQSWPQPPQHFVSSFDLSTCTVDLQATHTRGNPYLCTWVWVVVGTCLGKSQDTQGLLMLFPINYHAPWGANVPHAFFLHSCISRHHMCYSLPTRVSMVPHYFLFQCVSIPYLWQLPLSHLSFPPLPMPRHLHCTICTVALKRQNAWELGVASGQQGMTAATEAVNSQVHHLALHSTPLPQADDLGNDLDGTKTTTGSSNDRSWVRRCMRIATCKGPADSMTPATVSPECQWYVDGAGAQAIFIVGMIYMLDCLALG
jgi:hypothetical protein